MGTAPISVDLGATRRRVRRLRRYVERGLLDQGEFLCPHFDACRASIAAGDQFREGTMSHVGRRFDLVRDGEPLRVVVVGQESGLSNDPWAMWDRKVSLAARYQQVHDVSGLQKRYYASDGYPGRNPHMRGTTSALRVVFGRDPGIDHAGEWVQPLNGARFHLFDGFALVNRLLCSAGSVGTSQGRPTRTMFSNCAEHFAATIAILEPTLVIVQGSSVARWVNMVYEPERVVSPNLHEARVGELRTMVCTFSHPSARGAVRWGDQPDAEYIQQVVTPTLQRALQRS